MGILKVVLPLLAVSFLLNAGLVRSVSSEPLSFAMAGKHDSSGPLLQRKPHRPPAHTVLEPWMSADSIVMKFAEGSGVRLRNGRLLSMAGADMQHVNRVLARSGIMGSAIEPLLDRPESLLAREKTAGEQRTGKQLADLRLYYLVNLHGGVDVAQVCDDLNKLGIIEVAFPPALPAPPPGLDTPDFVYLQGYRNQLAGGIGVDAVAAVPGVDGAGVIIADIEYDWELNHEDLRLPSATNTDPETISNPYPPANHGTAVLGMLVGRDNGFGITGIVPAATARVFPTTTVRFKYNPGRAINRAAAALRPGDVMLLEIQTWVCNTGEYGPAEWSPVVFDVVENATALGIVVVAVAGNGNVDLDQPACNGLFDRSVRDSGTIIVGAGVAGTNSKTSFSTYGSRIDVQGWGDWTVATTGYGNLYDPLAGDLKRMYTHTFSGTSSATPLVAGAAVAVQGALRAAGDEPLDSYAMRTLLQQTGRPQAAGAFTGHIGPLPDVPAALASLFGWHAIDIEPQNDINFIDTARPTQSVSVAVLSTFIADGESADFDVSLLDETTVRFGPAQAVPISPVNYSDVDADGDADAAFEFLIGDAGIACEDTAATLTGATHAGALVQGTDRIATPFCPDTGCHP